MEETVAIIQGQLLDMREELNYTGSEDSDISYVTDETYKSELKESHSNNEETQNKITPTTPKFTGEFSYEALEYWANKGRSERETLRESSINIEDKAKMGKHIRYESESTKLECEIWDYRCNKQTSRKKHMNSKH